MATHKFRDAVQRGGALLTAAGMLAALAVAAFPAHVFADALNPLTERSLKLSSSSPGWSYKDGSGNDTYAPPNSGANGQKTGNEFSFRMSTKNGTVRAVTLQYCTTPAGDCIAPGDNTINARDVNPDEGDYSTVVGTGTLDLEEDSDQVVGDNTQFLTQLNEGSIIVTAGGNVYFVESIQDNTHLTLTTTATETEEGVTFRYRQGDTDSTSDLNVVTDNPTMISSSDWSAISGRPDKTPNRDGSEGNFVVLHAAADTVMATVPQWSSYSYADNPWTMEASNNETTDIAQGGGTGRNNFIVIKSNDGQDLSGLSDGDGYGDYFKVIFFGTDDNYITNPGSGSFFVRMMTYADTALTQPIDGGVTVANVMNESITIRTRVQETMDFSVGTHDPMLYLDSELTNVGELPHGQCNALLMKNPLSQSYATDENNVIYLGDPNAENSLDTMRAYAAQSYWRLSSNSSAGATVYYTGHTLTNTVGDEIAPLPEVPGGTPSQTGTEQFGLGIAYTSDQTYFPGTEIYRVWELGTDPYGDLTEDQEDGSFASYILQAIEERGYDVLPTLEDQLRAIDDYVHLPRLYPLVPMPAYANSAGDINTTTPKFSFNSNADTFAIPLATNNEQVVNCATAKMRYIANIAATTPAGIYTTKINYVAAPQY